MRVGRTILAVVGVGVAGVGLAIAATSAPVASAAMAAATERLGNDYLLVAVVGAAALVLAGVFVAVRVVSGIDQITPPAPEGIPTGPRPGGEFDRYVSGRLRVGAVVLSDESDRIEERLRETAIQALMQHTAASREDARRQVDRGSWTSDVDAAAYLAGADGPDVPWRSRATAALAGRTWQQRGARRAANGIVSLAEEDAE